MTGLTVIAALWIVAIIIFGAITLLQRHGYWKPVPGWMVVPIWLGLGAAFVAWKEPDDWFRALVVFGLALGAAHAAHDWSE
jgi:hypothetical protein